MMIRKIFICIQIIFVLWIYGQYIKDQVINDSFYVFDNIIRIVIAFFIFTVAGFMAKYDIDKKLEWKIFIPFGVGLIPLISLVL